MKIDDFVEKCKEYAKSTGTNVENDNLDTILQRDATAEADNLFEKFPYVVKSILSLGNSFLISQRKNELLNQVDDTLLSNELDRYHRIIGELGFEKVFEETFSSSSSGQDEKYFIFWRSNGGLLLSHDTFHNRVNGGKVFFNWRKNADSDYFPEGVSGRYHIKDRSGEVSFSELYSGPNHTLTVDKEVLARHALWEEKWKRESVFAGDFDCREAIRRKIRKLEETGIFLNPWEFQPFLWLLHHGEKNTNYEGINQVKIKKLSLEIRNAISPLE